jgi:hypothetical protein
LFTFDLGEDFVGWFGPDEGVCSLVPAGDEVPDLADEVADRREGSSADGLAFDDASTRFSQDPEVVVKWTWILGLAARQASVRRYYDYKAGRFVVVRCAVPGPSLRSVDEVQQKYSQCSATAHGRHSPPRP